MLELDQLLAPINGANPCGEDLSFSPEVDAIVEARRYDDPSLDQGEWVTELKEADWSFVVERCSQLIATRSKDLRLAVWLAEAKAKTKQFRGLGEAFLLLAGLCDQYWGNLYPLPDDGDQEQRIGNLCWLLARAAQLVREMPITEGEHSAFSTIDFEVARFHAANADKLGADAPKLPPHLKLSELEAARRKSSRTFYDALLADSQFCWNAAIQFEKSIDARLGVDGPGFSAVKDALESVIRAIAPLVQEAHAQEQEQEGSVAVAPGGSGPRNPLAARALIKGPIQTRAQALAQLRLVAEFFRQTEPHSPVAYLAEKAASWGELPLHQWLRSVVKDAGSLAHIEELLGLQAQNGND